MWTCLWKWAMGRGWKNTEKHDRKSSDCLEQTTSRNMHIKDCASNGSENVRSVVEKNKRSIVWGKGIVPVNPFQLDKGRPHLLSPL